MTITIDEVLELVSDWHGKVISIEPLSGGITNSNLKNNCEWVFVFRFDS